ADSGGRLAAELHETEGSSIDVERGARAVVGSEVDHAVVAGCRAHSRVDGDVVADDDGVLVEIRKEGDDAVEPAPSLSVELGPGALALEDRREPGAALVQVVGK